LTPQLALVAPTRRVRATDIAVWLIKLAELIDHGDVQRVGVLGRV
jgi:hypothetical protein